VDECKPLPMTLYTPPMMAISQGLTLVHFPAQRKHFLWDGGAFRGCSWGIQEMLGGVGGVQGVFVPEMAQVELKSVRV